ncbi:MAG TPA: glycosyltransferase [Actinomycetota bacterium]|jgi:UDP-N-acetylglucosamine transferase subunit ALG13|nr:glycosyltransferase [Actinomycetota bacterium]
MGASPPLVFVTVGTDHHPFDRLVAWVDAWAAERGGAVRCVVQHGRSKAPSFAEGRAFLPSAELARLMGEASIVVAHGGPGTILGARDAGSMPVVVARRPDLGEHVDGHQARFVARLAESGEVHRASDEAELRALLDRALADPSAFRRTREDGGGEGTAARFGTLLDGLIERSKARGPRILYVAGWGRSGSTLLDRMLGQVPGMFSVGEVRDVWRRGVLEDRLCGCGQRFSACEVWTEIGRRAFGGWEGVDVLEMQYLRDRLDRPWAPPLVLGSRVLPGLDRDVARYVEVLERLYLAIHETTGASVVVDSSKIPTYLLLLRRIPVVDLRVVHLVRDSRGVVFSWQRHVDRIDGVEEPPPDTDELLRYGTGSAAARYLFYNGLTHAVQLGLPSLFLRYEDLVRAPSPALGAVLRLAGTSAGDGVLGFVSDRSVELDVNHTVDGNPMRLSTGTVELREDDEWRRRMEPRARRLVSAVTAPLLARYGYRPWGEE